MFSWRLQWQTTSYNGKRQPFNVFIDLLIATARWRWSYDRYRSTPFALDLALDKLVRSIARYRSQKNERSLNRSRSINRSRTLCSPPPSSSFLCPFFWRTPGVLWWKERPNRKTQTFYYFLFSLSSLVLAAIQLWMSRLQCNRLGS